MKNRKSMLLLIVITVGFMALSQAARAGSSCEGQNTKSFEYMKPADQQPQQSSSGDTKASKAESAAVAKPQKK